VPSWALLPVKERWQIVSVLHVLGAPTAMASSSQPNSEGTFLPQNMDRGIDLYAWVTNLFGCRCINQIMPTDDGSNSIWRIRYVAKKAWEK